jgi:glycosyltransferase involved in cell wall biosynthesis
MSEQTLSIIIPARNEEFLSRTIEDICANAIGNTEIIVVLDGAWANPPIKNHPMVKIIFFPESVGQRAAINYGVRLSKAKYIMKCDAHCAFDHGFDVKMMNLMEDDITMVPVMRNLHVFNWRCPDGHTRYQGPSGPCEQCGKETTKEVVWIPKTNPSSTAYRFDRTMHFQYWNDFGKLQSGELTETMSIQGSCFMLTREKYWELNICDEAFGSWGQQGVEVALKTWLSGGRVMTNRTTWYAHLFRTQGGDFGFPYENKESDISKAREYCRDLFLKNKWPGAKYPFNWVINKFKPPEWETEGPTQGVLYYTDNCLNMRLAKTVRDQISRSRVHVTSVSLKPMPFGDNFVVNEERSYKTMFKQILKGLEEMKEDIVYFCEHDVMYHPDHFKFIPQNKNTWYYNGNYWFVRMSDGFAIHYNVSPLSGLVVYRETALTHFRERLEMIESLGDDYQARHMGFEPFTHGRIKWKFWCPYEIFMPEHPNVDITHANNSTWKRWDQKHFIKKPEFWEEGKLEDLWCGEQLKQFLGTK